MTARAWILALFALLLAGVSALAVVRCEGAPPEVESPESLLLGTRPTSITLVVADEGSGVRSVDVVLVHAGGEVRLPGFRDPAPEAWLTSTHPRSVDVPVSLDAGELGLEEGLARLRIVARDGSWRSGLRGNETLVEIPLQIDLHAPRIAIESGLTYVRQGGSGALVYELGEPPARDGVDALEHVFPGHPHPGAGGRGLLRIALFGLPLEAPARAPIRVFAEDAAGNRATARPAVRVQERPRFPEIPIRLSSQFLETKVLPLAEEAGFDTSDPAEAFRAVNEELRARNEARIQELVAKTEPRPLFSGAFLQLPGSKVTSLFGEKRGYYLDGRLVSKAVHYGYDLAATSRAPVPAANSGIVRFAAPLGIYGNCVILDHGLGLASLYGHLSSMAVEVGEHVEKGQTLGRSGDTGLAGGDHLHFSILVYGAYVDPLEWWDPKWVRERIAARLEAPTP